MRQPDSVPVGGSAAAPPPVRQGRARVATAGGFAIGTGLLLAAVSIPSALEDGGIGALLGGALVVLVGLGFALAGLALILRERWAYWTCLGMSAALAIVTLVDGLRTGSGAIVSVLIYAVPVALLVRPSSHRRADRPFLAWRKRSGNGSSVPAQPQWTEGDERMHYTAALATHLVEERLHEWRPIPTRKRTDPGEIPLMETPVNPWTFRPVGDGTYMHRSSIAIGDTGFVATQQALTALGNAAAKWEAKENAKPRWVYEGYGEVLITDRRIHLLSADYNYSVYYGALDTVDLVNEENIYLRYNSDDGRDVHLQLNGFWAPLAFVLAAGSSFPNHPGWARHEWLPEGFEDHCARFGKEVPALRSPTERRPQ
ncbi:hypothetical protein [Salininema proteolyticum]|uniref:Uncharacterized protein n=1 Tax=Salininema proteolyticum TaxID=1607685 RepID=A0ABV8U0K0_9ACTN